MASNGVSTAVVLANASAAVLSTSTSTTTQDILNPGSADAQGLSPEVWKLWSKLCPKFTQQQRLEFANLLCNDLQGYVVSIETDCQQLHDDSAATKIQAWLEPIHMIAEITSPFAKIATAAAGVPFPADAVLGGIRGILKITKSIPDLQARALRLLSQMGDQAKIVKKYNWTLYRNDSEMHEVVLTVCSDIALFCETVYDLFGETEDSRFKRFKNKLDMAFRSKFTNNLSKHVNKFERDVLTLERTVLAVSFRKQQQMADDQKTRNRRDDAFQSFMVSAADAHERFLMEERMLREEIQAQREREAQQQLYISCLEWLSNLDFYGQYIRRCKTHHVGTGEWFYTCEEYQKWKTSPGSSLLWVRGKTGCGKSILSAVAITDLSDSPDTDVGIAYALFDRNSQNKQTMTSVMMALIKQLSIQRGQVAPEVMDAYHTCRLGGTLEDDKAFELLKYTCGMFDTLYLIIDALDEYKEPEQLLPLLLDLVSKGKRTDSCFKILIANRPFPKIQDFLGPSFTPVIPEDRNKGDIDRYIEFHLPGEEFAKARGLARDKAKGMFQWVELIFKDFDIQMASSEEEITEIIEEFPPDLEGVYDKMFEVVCRQSAPIRKKAWLVLQWILKACNPLSVKDLQAALTNYSDARSIHDIDKRLTAENLLKMCNYLIDADNDGQVSFIHESVRLYLNNEKPKYSRLKDFQEDCNHTHSKMAMACLNYLALKEFDTEIPTTPQELAEVGLKAPFFAYAAQHWGTHAFQGDPVILRSPLLQLLRSTSRREWSLQYILWNPSDDDSDFWAFPGSTCELHLLALFDFPAQPWDFLTPYLSNISKADGSGKTPIDYALEYGNHRTIFYLLDQYSQGAQTIISPTVLAEVFQLAAYRGWIDVLNKAYLMIGDGEVEEKTMTSALYLACLGREEEAAAKLISLGASPNGIANTPVVPLVVAAQNGASQMVLLLLEHGANVNIQDHGGDTALHWASSKNEEIMAEALLGKGANPTLKSEANGYTSLHEAAVENSYLVLRTILRLLPNTNLEVPDDSGLTPLHTAVWTKSMESVIFLVESGSHVDSTDLSGSTPLHYAAENGLVEIVKFLLLSHCSLAKHNDRHVNALHIAARHSQTAVLEAIFERPQDEWIELLEKPSLDGHRPLHEACLAGSKTCIELLVSKGANCNAKGVLGASPLHYLAHFGEHHSIKTLLQKTRNPAPEDENGDTPLHFAARADSSEFIEQFISVCSEMNLPLDYSKQNNFRNTPIHVAAEQESDIALNLFLPRTPTSVFSVKNTSDNQLIHPAAWAGHTSLVRAILDHDTSFVSNQGYGGRSPIIMAIMKGHLDVFEYLLPLSLGCLELADKGGRTPLMVALKFRKVEMANALLNQNVNVNVKDDEKNGALHFAAACGDKKLFSRLLAMGCRTYQANEYLETPLFPLAQHSAIEMIRELHQSGFDDFLAKDRRGRNAAFRAIDRGSTEACQSLSDMGLRFDIPDADGLTPAHVAAENGHVDSLLWLHSKGVDIHASTKENVTTFMQAIVAGQLGATKCLLALRPSAIHDAELLTGETPLIVAAGVGCPTICDLLIAAGMDLDATDAIGYSANDLLRLFQGLDFECTDAEMSQRSGLRLALISKYINQLLTLHSNRTAEYFILLERYFERLARLLRLHGDFEMSKLCLAPWYFEPFSSKLLPSVTSICQGCGSDLMQQDFFACKQCYYDFYLCKDCYQDYLAAKRDIPEALNVLYGLEERTRAVRSECSEFEDCTEIVLAMRALNINSNFLVETNALYEQWEKKYATTERYRSFPRPGQQWLRLVKELIEWTEIEDDDEEKVKREYEEFTDKFAKLAKTHRVDQVLSPFRCEKHDYLEIKQSDYDQATKMEESLRLYDLETGLPTDRLLQLLTSKYHLESEPVLREEKDVITASEQSVSRTILPTVAGQASKTVEGQSDLYDRSTSVDTSRKEEQSSKHEIDPPMGIARRRTQLSEIDKETQAKVDDDDELSNLVGSIEAISRKNSGFTNLNWDKVRSTDDPEIETKTDEVSEDLQINDSIVGSAQKGNKLMEDVQQEPVNLMDLAMIAASASDSDAEEMLQTNPQQVKNVPISGQISDEPESPVDSTTSKRRVRLYKILESRDPFHTRAILLGLKVANAISPGYAIRFIDYNFVKILRPFDLKEDDTQQ